MTRFEQSVTLPASPDEVYRWHARPGALDRMLPPWEDVRVLERGDGLRVGSRVVFETRVGPLAQRWTAEHADVVDGERFRDVQVSGPFAAWEHTHSVHPAAGSAGAEDARSVLRDRIEYELPLGTLGTLLGGAWVRRRLERMFRYRHRVLARDLMRHARGPHLDMKVCISGSTGLVGSALVPFLTSGGHRVVRLVRGKPAGAGDVRWDPERGELDGAALEGVDAVVHLAGEGIAGKRWSPAQKTRIASSRVTGTRTLCEALAGLSKRPRVLVSASAVGFYGDRGDEEVDEASLPGAGFLAETCRDWEAATKAAVEAGIRVVNLRFGVILSPRGGALQRMLLPFKLGGGGPLGTGRQWMSWIALDDAVGAVHHALVTESLAGPVNAVAPHPVTNRDFARTLGAVLGRPAVLPMPSFAARLLFGEVADEVLLVGQKVRPLALQRSGFAFAEPELQGALRHLLGR